MRIWDISPRLLCRVHLLGEHRELHAIWSVHVNHKRGYSKHPETVRWSGKLAALYARHEKLVREMNRRGYLHASPLDQLHATGSRVQTLFIDSPARQREILREKSCSCFGGISLKE